jgi:hypothetical protein
VTTNQGFKSVIPNPEIGTAFVYCFLRRNKERIADMGAGTTFPEVSGKTMKSVEITLPSTEDCAELTSFAKPILAALKNNEEETHMLSNLRDALLPKLMSGEIDVTKVDLTQLNNHLVYKPLAQTDLGWLPINIGMRTPSATRLMASSKWRMLFGLFVMIRSPFSLPLPLLR